MTTKQNLRKLKEMKLQLIFFFGKRKSNFAYFGKGSKITTNLEHSTTRSVSPNVAKTNKKHTFLCDYDFVYEFFFVGFDLAVNDTAERDRTTKRITFSAAWLVT